MENPSEKNYPKFFKDIESYCPEEVSKISEEDGENAIIYGIPCFKIEKGKSDEGFIFLSESLSDFITFSNKNEEEIENLNIKIIHQITFNQESENLKGYKKKNEKEIFFQILIGQKSHDFGMNSKEQLLLAIKGLLSIFTKKEIKSEESDNKVKKEIHILEKDSLLKNESLNKNVNEKINMIIPYRIFIFAILFLSMILFIILLFS